MNRHIIRAYNNFIVDKYKGILSKSSDESRLAEEIEYHNLIQTYKDINIYFPRYIGKSKTSTNGKESFTLNLEYLPMNNLGNIMLQPFSINIWKDIVDLLKHALNEFKKYEYDNNIEYSYNMYINKTLKYYKELKDNFTQFTQICNHDKLIINEKEYSNFKIIWPKIEKYINDKLLRNKYAVIHGDFCFSNILYAKNPISNIGIVRFVDPRGSFGKIGVVGDPVYDIAKLRHSYEGGYEYIIYDKFSLNYNKILDSFNISFVDDNRNQIKLMFDKYSEFTTLETKLVEALIFIGMCSRHYDSLNRQIVMYCTGIKLLNEITKEI
jgi:hypothetical protein